MRDVEVYRAELLAAEDGFAHYEIECSAGTYVRTLVETLGDAYCSELRRTAIGPFRVEDAGARGAAVEPRSRELRPAPVAEALSLMSDRGHPARRTPSRGRAQRRDRHLRRRPPRPPAR